MDCMDKSRDMHSDYTIAGNNSIYCILRTRKRTKLKEKTSVSVTNLDLEHEKVQCFVSQTYALL